MTNRPPLRPATPIDAELSNTDEKPTKIEEKKRDTEEEADGRNPS